MSDLLLHPFHLLLLATLLAIALAIVYSTHNHRQNSILLREQNQLHKELEIEYAKQRLEEGALADYRKIKRLAEDQLQLRTPLLEQHVRVTP